ncbi:putative phospho-2-dehydro-3-deoxyheptonate aldolase [Xylariaceae sp. FL0804]|nr:putative phospho-2-dehydro-3-deoxyheptonate aldolase [Xylariaceae sp. FL0804]
METLNDANRRLSPALLKAELPLDAPTRKSVASARASVQAVLSSPLRDDRLLVVVGPCSIHDSASAIDYAERLARLSARLRRDLVVVMRVYVEKPRTTVGWKGLVHDPTLLQEQEEDREHQQPPQLGRGLRAARAVMRRVAELGLPVATELLSPLAAPFLDDAVALGVVGARTTESQTHRELASDVPFPVGFKNGTDGGVGAALDAVVAAARPHAVLAADAEGRLEQRRTAGNPATFVVLRGGRAGPNFAPEHVRAAEQAVRARGRDARLVVDCSHGNSAKDYRNQARVAASVGEQIARGSAIAGVMIESHINAGRQDIPANGLAGLRYGVSVTDGCVGWEETEEMLEKLAAAVRARRGASLRMAVAAAHNSQSLPSFEVLAESPVAAQGAHGIPVRS